MLLRTASACSKRRDAMFREHGIEVSVGEIADAAGVGRGTLFRNFKNKDALIAAVVGERLGEVIDYGRQLLVRRPRRCRGRRSRSSPVWWSARRRTGRCCRR